jgi:hypothetical protein
MMTRAIMCAAAAAVVFALTSPVSAAPAAIDPGLSKASPPIVQDVRYWRHRHYRQRHWHCRWWHGRRHCGWRYW